MTRLSVTEGSPSYVSSIAYFSLFVLILFLLLSDLLCSVELSLVVTLSYLLSAVEQTCNKFSSLIIPFDLLLSKFQTCKIGICCMPVISVLTGSTCELKA